MISDLKKLIFACFIFSFPVEVSAQKTVSLEPALIECRYLETAMKDTLNRRSEADTMILRIGRNVSSFYSKDALFVDSLKRTPGGFNKWVELMRQYLKEGRHQDLLSNDRAYYYLDFPKPGKLTVRTELGRRGIEYTEEREPIEWKFQDSVKTVLGFECHLAEADFRGRRYLAWYTLEIPVSMGPWKLWGLPGLICEAHDERGHYSYSLVSFTPEPGNDVALYDWYKKYERKTRFELYEAFEKNTELLREDARQNGMSDMLEPNHSPGPKELDWKW